MKIACVNDARAPRIAYIADVAVFEDFAVRMSFQVAVPALIFVRIAGAFAWIGSGRTNAAFT